jgi:hypothetical protein
MIVLVFLVLSARPAASSPAPTIFGQSIQEDAMETTHIPTFDEFVDLVRIRLGMKDALDDSALHDFKPLMSDYADVVPENWYADAFEELEAQGHLHPASGQTFGGAFARLSADGRLFLRS